MKFLLLLKSGIIGRIEQQNFSITIAVYIFDTKKLTLYASYACITLKIRTHLTYTIVLMYV